MARLKPASSIDLNSEDGVDVWPEVDKDMVIETVSLFVMIARKNGKSIWESTRKHEASWCASCIPHINESQVTGDR